MPWNETDPMNERVKFIAACLARDESDETFAELCERFGITPKSGYKWFNRYEDGGVANLVEHSGVSKCHVDTAAGCERAPRAPTWVQMPWAPVTAIE
jgi:hypothetical protein